VSALPILLGAPGLAGEPELVTALTRPGAPVTVVRRCVDAVDLLRGVADVRLDAERAQRGEPAGVLGVAAADRDAARHEDARDARHACAADADDVHAPEGGQVGGCVQGRGHACPPVVAVPAAAASSTSALSLSSASR